MLVSLLKVVRMPYVLFGIVEKFKETNTIIAWTLKGMSVGCCLHNLKWCLISQSLTFFCVCSTGEMWWSKYSGLISYTVPYCCKLSLEMFYYYCTNWNIWRKLWMFHQKRLKHSTYVGVRDGLEVCIHKTITEKPKTWNGYINYYWIFIIYFVIHRRGLKKLSVQMSKSKQRFSYWQRLQQPSRLCFHVVQY